MDELEKNMENILNIEVSDTLEGGCTTRKDQLKDVSEDREKDYEYTRGQLYSLIDSLNSPEVQLIQRHFPRLKVNP